MTSRCRRAAPARLVAIALAVLTAGCASSAPSSTPVASGAGQPSDPPVFGRDWGRSTTIVERPEEAFESLDPSVLLPEGSGRSGHPSHFPGQAVMADVARMSGGYVSVGYVYPGWHPVAWTSPDGEGWSLHRMGETDYTFPVALAVGADGTIVAVGRSGALPVAWTSSDGVSWTVHEVPILGSAGVAERMTTVLAVGDGFLAGGSIGPETLARDARFWHSTDGVAWTAVVDDAAAFADAEVRSIARTGAGYVAVGILGEAFRPTGSVAWTSRDGERWTRVDAPDLLAGRTVALTPGPGSGLVAVGVDVDGRLALAWTSPDGRTWTLAPTEESRRHPGGYIRMSDVTVVDGTFIAVGDYSGLQYATMVAWSSPDGVHWTQAHEVPAFGQCEPYGVVAGPVPLAGGATVPGVVAVGSFGNPDDYVPTAWLSPAH